VDSGVDGISVWLPMRTRFDSPATSSCQLEPSQIRSWGVQKAQPQASQLGHEMSKASERGRGRSWIFGLCCMIHHISRSAACTADTDQEKGTWGQTKPLGGPDIAI